MKESTAEERIRALQVRHQALEDELKYLARRAYLTPTEQKVERELKKQKLSAKDELYALQRDFSES